jgi:polysaccharide deacetylase family protein (PEP-CTERM system associated)
MDIHKNILLTIDVEDWFQVENFKPWIPFETWGQRELRVERNVHRLLDLFDSFEVSHRVWRKGHGEEDTTDKMEKLEKNKFHKPCKSCPTNNYKIESNPRSKYEQSAISYELNSNGQRTNDNGHKKKVHATFFVLGWIAEKLPHLVREINSRGHEVASHGYNHNLCNQQSHADLKQELTDSKKLLEDITGAQIFGFRAPNFSIDIDSLKIIEDTGYLYDSSYNSFGFHGRYGKISLNGHSKNGIALKISENFFELPISNIHFNYPLGSRKSLVLPWGGGAYFRIVPLPLFSLGLNDILKKESAYLFYIHPWEVDWQQPRLNKASIAFKLRHYINLSQTEPKLAKLIKNFRYCQFTNCYQYLKHLLPDHN